MSIDSSKNLAVIDIVANASRHLTGLFGFEVEFAGDDMMALQSAIYDIFGERISTATLNPDYEVEADKHWIIPPLLRRKLAEG